MCFKMRRASTRDYTVVIYMFIGNGHLTYVWPLALVKSNIIAWTYLQLPLRQWGAGNVYLLVLSSWKVNIAENPIAVMGL